jgi:hypothetical protein
MRDRHGSGGGTRRYSTRGREHAADAYRQAAAEIRVPAAAEDRRGGS